MKKFFVFLFWLVSLQLKAQVPISIGTDLSLLRQLSDNQQFWAVGQTVQVNFHFKEKETAYALVSYYTNGKFKNNTTTFAKESNIVPASINYTTNSLVRYRQISLGWKHFFKGNYSNENSLNIYGTAGFGLLFGRAETTTNITIDTSRYNAKPIAGAGGFKRLTFDLALGGDKHIGGNIYFYSELRSWLQASESSTPLLYNDEFPFVISINGGIRIFIN